MGMASQSSSETRSRAKELAKDIGSYHVDMDIDDAFHGKSQMGKKSNGQLLSVNANLF
jgi:NAD+ synthase (glutamine-hydrolysing)